MNDPQKCQWTLDCAGLQYIGHVLLHGTSNSLKTLYAEQLQSGAICVPVVVLQELEEAYEDEAQVLRPLIKTKIALNKRKYTAGAGAIAERIKVDLTTGSHERHTDIYAASIAGAEGYTLLTIEGNVSYYERMEACAVHDVKAWATTHGPALDPAHAADVTLAKMVE
jgi:hypothetical protein